MHTKMYYTYTLLQMSASKILYQSFQDEHGAIREADRHHHFPPKFMLKVARQDLMTQSEFKYDICAQNESQKVLFCGGLFIHPVQSKL